jgi:type IV pilus assembly protein PilA
MYSFRKSKKGFTLIELMVVVAIIGILALLGLRLYLTQQEKAKQSIVKANAGTAQTLCQSELADIDMWATAAAAVTYLVALAPGASGMQNPYNSASDVLVAGTAIDFALTGLPGDLSGDAAVVAGNMGMIIIVRNTNTDGARPHLLLQGIGHDGAGDPAVVGDMLMVFK